MEGYESVVYQVYLVGYGRGLAHGAGLVAFGVAIALIGSWIKKKVSASQVG